MSAPNPDESYSVPNGFYTVVVVPKPVDVVVPKCPVPRVVVPNPLPVVYPVVPVVPNPVPCSTILSPLPLLLLLLEELELLLDELECFLSKTLSSLM